jgi:hypothetical protein
LRDQSRLEELETGMHENDEDEEEQQQGMSTK